MPWECDDGPECHDGHGKDCYKQHPECAGFDTEDCNRPRSHSHCHHCYDGPECNDGWGKDCYDGHAECDGFSTEDCDRPRSHSQCHSEPCLDGPDCLAGFGGRRRLRRHCCYC